MLDTIAKPFGMLMMFIYKLTGNFGASVILFGIAMCLILLPFMAKSKKSMMRMTRLQPRINELQKKHEGNQQVLNAETQRLYREANANPMSGCLWSLLPFPIMLALYRAVVKPLTIMMGIASDLLAEGGAITTKLTELGYVASTGNSYYEEIFKSKFITEHFDQFAGLSDKLVEMNYTFLGLDLSATPNWKFWNFDFSNGTWIVIGLFMIPLISTALSYLSMFVTQKMQGNTGNEQAQATNKSMMYMMPLMSLWIGYIMPAAMGIYWIINSLTGIIRDIALTTIYKKKMDIEDAEFNKKERARDAELEAKRAETERLRALNATTENKSTSKKKQHTKVKQTDAERKAAAQREERAARRERLGITLPEQPESQVGSRRYARGRAFVDDRYENPEDAEEATLAAAAESEFGESIDVDIEDSVLKNIDSEEVTELESEDLDYGETSEDEEEQE